jgi:glycoside hydrolase-like protein
MNRCFHIALALILSALTAAAQTSAQPTYLGFDRNDYPGDQNLKLLHQTFAYSGFWLNNPPGATRNTWTGKRQALAAEGFGFLVLFNGRLYAEIKKFPSASALGQKDAAAAVAAAKREGFTPRTIIFLDQEQGGRLLPEQRAYLHAWVDGVNSSGFRAGVYCSGIAFQEDKNNVVITAEDIRKNAGGRNIVYWVTNDACPPSPGCVLKNPPPPVQSGVPFATVWQFAQSPKRPDVAGSCPAYHSDGNCYASGSDAAAHLHLDANSAMTDDPSETRSKP